MNQETSNPGNLIKSDKRRTPVKTTTDNQKIIKNQIISARAEAARIVAEAEAFAHDTHQKAVEEAEEMREQAYREGTETALTETDLRRACDLPAARK